jgi:hypothetical protein
MLRVRRVAATSMRAQCEIYIHGPFLDCEMEDEGYLKNRKKI